MSSPSMQSAAVSADIVFIDSIDLSANIGADWWGRDRAQPVAVSVSLHLRPSSLDTAGATDDVRASVHYGHLCKNISALVTDPTASFDGAAGLARAVTQVAFEMASTVAAQVHVGIASAKLVPLARKFVLEMTTPVLPGPAHLGGPPAVQVSVTDLVLPAIIGVNAPERIAKQRVVTSITVVEKAGSLVRVDYPALVAKLSKDIEASSFLTLEKFVLEIVRAVCYSSEAIDTVTVRAEKPSALSFAQAAGVQITRSRSAFVRNEDSAMIA
ncbi:Dihydroneopterin aldolase-domain-containing protein [Amylocystis lapponica]|nr:Dihydroneopterin aldolase-domain-containing protein [Amylocystis lapponica]